MDPTEAIRNAVAEEDGSTQLQQTDQAPQTETQTTQGTPQEDSLFKDINVNQLPPDLRSLHDSLKADYTRKTQALSEQRKEYESLGNVDEVRNAVEFVQALQDPNNLVQLHSELSDYLQQNGLTKEQADIVATSEVQNQVSQTTPQIQDEFDLPDNEFSSSDPRMDQLNRELEEMKQFREQYEQERLQNEIETNIAKQENVIRQTNPTYTDDDMASVYQYAYAYGGDLIAAQKAYEGERQRILSSYINDKSVIPHSVAPPSLGAPGSEIPEKFDSFEEAHRYAKQKAATIASMGGLDE